MKLQEYVEDHILFIITSAIWLFLQGITLTFLAVEPFIITLLSIVWFMLLGSYIMISFLRKRKRANQLLAIMNELDQTYLLHEVMPKKGTAEERFYRYLMRMSNKSMTEHVSAIKRERREYQEYVEQWVHEIKTPLAAMKLWSENSNDVRKKSMMRQLERTQHYVDQALFYARSETVEKDFQVSSIRLSHCIQEAFLECKYACTFAQMRVDLPDHDAEVFTDEKWLIFILVQLIDNALKYRNQESPILTINLSIEDNKTCLALHDNGIGITSQDVSRVFEKGFTGENGRHANTHATGIGLYLCKRLGTQINLDIALESDQTSGTTVFLTFTS